MTTRPTPTMDDFVETTPDRAEEIIPENYMREGEAIISPSEQSGDPSRMSVTSLRYKGYVQVWDTQTGGESLQPWWLLWQTMRKRHEDGTQMFTRVNPNIPPNHGEDLFCPLNPNGPDYEMFSGMGFKVCKKQHIPHADAQNQHVSKSHKRAWSAMERVKADRLRNEDMSLRREAIDTQNRFMEQMMGRVAGTEATATSAGTEINITSSSTEQQVEVASAKPRFSVSCETCGEVFERGSKGFAKMAMQRHAGKVHGT